jgi:hypothetical protein
VPQLPQLFESFLVSTHAPLHTVVAQAGAPSPSVAASFASFAADPSPGAGFIVASGSVEKFPPSAPWPSNGWKLQTFAHAASESHRAAMSHAFRMPITISRQERDPRSKDRP